MPKQLCDVMDLEVAKFLRLTASTVERVQFHVSRTSELKQFFNDDIFAETRARVSSVDAASWAGGLGAARRVLLLGRGMLSASPRRASRKQSGAASER